MTMFHSGPNGPGRCNAKKGKCPFGGESGSENHFNTMKEAEEAFAKTQGGNPPPPLKKTASKDARIKKDLSKLIDNAELSDSHGGINGMSDKFLETVRNNPDFKNELNGMVKSAGFSPDDYHVSAIMEKDSLEGGNLYNMINFQAQEIDFENYDWDAHDDGEEADLEQTEKYYNQFLKEDSTNLSNPMVEIDYNGKKYAAFISNDKEERAAFYGDDVNKISQESIKNFEDAISDDDLYDNHGMYDNMSDAFWEKVENDPQLKQQLDQVLDNSGYDRETYNIRMIVPTDSHKVTHIINQMANEGDEPDYDYDAYLDDEEEAIEQTQKYYDKYINEDKRAKESGNPRSLALVESEYNGRKYLLFLSDEK